MNIAEAACFVVLVVARAEARETIRGERLGADELI